MPKARGQQTDVIGFTRIFVLFCTLVLVPALFLSGFGVIAILNERQAEKQRRHDEAAAVSRQAEEALGGLLDTTDRAAMRALDEPSPSAAFAALARSAAPVGSYLVLDPNGAPLFGSPPFVDTPAVLEHLAHLAERTAPRRPAHAAVDEGGFVGVVSIQRAEDGRAVVYAIDDKKLDDAVRAAVDSHNMLLHIRTTRFDEEPVPNAVDRLLEYVRSRPEDSELVAHRLEAPFDRFTVVVESASPGSHITLIAYIVSLVLFLATLITGVVITARLIWQETRLSRLKTDFVSHMSHELRTPLTSIRMFIDTLRLHRASEEEQQECLDLLAKETERLSEMIERVLGYARLRAGRRLFNPTPVPVSAVVDEALDAFRAQQIQLGTGDEETARLALTTEVDGGLPPVHADREALVEALLNLVSNAYKYTGPQKEITVFARPGKRGRVQIGVRDNGPGLPKGEHARVFERFYQAGGLLSRKQAGSGLGLAITRAIIEGNGGKIHVESEPDKGATFVIELRAEDGQDGAARDVKSSPAASKAA